MSHPAPDSPEPFPEDWADRLGKSTDQLAGPGAPAAYMKPVPFGCMAVLIALGGLFVGPLATVALAMGVSVVAGSAVDRLRPPFGAVAAIVLGMLGDMLWVVHWPSLVNWTHWP